MLLVPPVSSLSPFKILAAPSRLPPADSYPLSVSIPSLVSDHRRREAQMRQIVCMAPDEQRQTRRNPLDFPIEWERSKPGSRPDVIPQFSPMKTPLPPPMPADPPAEDEEKADEPEHIFLLSSDADAEAMTLTPLMFRSLVRLLTSLVSQPVSSVTTILYYSDLLPQNVVLERLVQPQMLDQENYLVHFLINFLRCFL